MPLNIELFEYEPLPPNSRIQEFRPLTTFSKMRIINDRPKQNDMLSKKFS
jgi:hypothetical protein